MNAVHGGDENFSISNLHGSAFVQLGDGNNVIDMSSGNITLGSSTANTGTNSVALLWGGAKVTLNGGTSNVTLADHAKGYDQVKLNGTSIGTSLTAHGSFGSVTLTADASAAITETRGEWRAEPDIGGRCDRRDRRCFSVWAGAG